MKKLMFVFALSMSAFACQAQKVAAPATTTATKSISKASPIEISMPNTQNISSDSTATDRVVPADNKKKKKKEQ